MPFSLSSPLMIHSAVYDVKSRGLPFYKPQCILLMNMAKKNPAAVKLGRKGGRNSRKNFTPEERKAMAQKAVRARWGKKKKEKESK
jgi:hypothetical protein